MKVYYDTEFIEDGRTIDLISIGLVAEDGAELYRVNKGAPWRRIRKHEWLMANVVPHLPRAYGDARRHMPKSWLCNMDSPLVKPSSAIAEDVAVFLLSRAPVELWAWYSAYDHVALCQLWGTMVGLPAGVPMWTNELKQECVRLGDPTMPKQAVGEHDALADARHVKVMAEFLAELTS